MSIKVSRILHAGYLFECQNTQIVFDPIFENPFSRNCFAFPSVNFNHEQIQKEKFSAVFISHFHDDHCSMESLNLIDRSTPIYMFCVFDEMFDLIRQLGFTEVYSLDLNIHIQVGPFEVIPRVALDADVDSLFQIKAEGLNILNVVDSWIGDATLGLLARSAPWDLLLWPFQTMRELEVIAPSRSQPASQDLPEEWIKQLQILNPRFLVPSSCQFIQEQWSWYNHAFFPISYKKFASKMEALLPQTQVVRINPSVSYLLTADSFELSSPISWIELVGEQMVDYDYQPSLKAPPTSEVAKHFEDLSREQKEYLLDYCRIGLIEKYLTLESDPDSFFAQNRIWELLLYSQDGSCVKFQYKIKGNIIELLAQSGGEPSWCTEVPAAKVYAALTQGESLTSMYVRINDREFSPDIVADLRNVDIGEDPLIRCLFTGNFASYQKAQLKMIRDRASKSSSS